MNREDNYVVKYRDGRNFLVTSDERNAITLSIQVNGSYKPVSQAQARRIVRDMWKKERERIRMVADRNYADGIPF